MEDKKEDFLSDLPEDLILKILHLLPTKDAVKTSILSSRWRNPWKFVNRVHVTFPDLCYQKVGISAASSILGLLNGIQSPKIFELHIERLPTDSLDHNLAHSVIEYSLDRHVQYLKLEFDHPSGGGYILPSNVFQITSLVRLDLHGWRIELPSSVSLQFLKTLVLHWNKMSGEDAQELISKCPSLERLALKIERRYLRGKVFVSHPCLVSLSFGLRVPIILKTPALKLLKFDNWSPSDEEHVYEDVSSLLTCEFYSSDELTRHESMILRKTVSEDLPGIKNIHLSQKCIQGLWRFKLSRPLLHCTSLALEVLFTYSDNLEEIAGVLPFFPSIRKLTFTFKDITFPYRAQFSWKLLKPSFSNMKDLKEVEIHSLIFCKLKFKHDVHGWHWVDIKQSLKLVEVLKENLRGLESLRVYLSQDMREAPPSFMHEFGARFKFIQDHIQASSPIATLYLVYT